MIYTIGHRESYTRYFKGSGKPMKKGRNIEENYEGGSVWEFYHEAQRCCPKEYKVYGVKADWNTDTAERWSDSGTHRDLLIDAELVEII